MGLHGPGSNLPWQSSEPQEIVDFTPALTLTTRADGAVDFFNLRWVEFIGAPTENLLGWRWTSYILPMTSTISSNAGKRQSARATRSRLKRESGVPTASTDGCCITAAPFVARTARY
jgi:hypothetical protein